MEWLMIFCYLLAAYGFSNMVTQGIGPKDLFVRLRVWADNVGPNFGKLFGCMMCFPMNLGMLCSIINWFFISMPLTPFNIIMYNVSSNWMFLICMFADGCITSAFCYILHIIVNYVEMSTPIFDDEVEHVDNHKNHE